jgi:hypothetical protein
METFQGTDIRLMPFGRIQNVRKRYTLYYRYYEPTGGIDTRVATKVCGVCVQYCAGQTYRVKRVARLSRKTGFSYLVK